MPNVDPYEDRVMEVVNEALAAFRHGHTPPDISGWRTRVRQALVELADHSAAHRENIVEGLIASDRNVEVSECYGCPFEYDTVACKHPDAEYVDIDCNDNAKPPHNCPLRSQSTRVLLKEGA